ncbi:hypothetical protein BD310DRAFT_200170 [Dichomitus squalens]|uniref:Uncharacterized protein n=1 Tax=Dichomitus squalens TaxID=114155 RepID=A0A4Q9PHB9_9APHY|nr:hypothetical protein BD310DRAFT_200170 [Dichomitus squalens]
MVIMLLRLLSPRHAAKHTSALASASSPYLTTETAQFHLFFRFSLLLLSGSFCFELEPAPFTPPLFLSAPHAPYPASCA